MYFLGNTIPNKWIIHLESGGWCFNEDACVQRTNTYVPRILARHSLYIFLVCCLMTAQTILISVAAWSMAHVRYCDGASFAGNV